jgi:nitroreductase
MTFLLRVNRIVKAYTSLKPIQLSLRQLSISSVKMSEPSGYTFDADVLKARKSDFPIHPMLLSRTSPREMTGQEMTDQELMGLFEAARWAPSHYNLQPWRFVYAKPKTEEWNKFMDLLWPLNKEWVQNASAMVVVISNRFHLYQGKKTEIPSHSYDAGAAWMSIALEGTARGLVVHGVGGFDYDNAYQVLKVPKESHNIDAMIIIGKPHPKDKRKKENISQRNPTKNYVFKGVFVNNDKI